MDPEPELLCHLQIRIQIQGLMTKNWEKNYNWKKIYIFWSKIAIIGFHKERPSCRRSLLHCLPGYGFVFPMRIRIQPTKMNSYPCGYGSATLVTSVPDSWRFDTDPDRWSVPLFSSVAFWTPSKNTIFLFITHTVGKFTSFIKSYGAGSAPRLKKVGGGRRKPL